MSYFFDLTNIINNLTQLNQNVNDRNLNNIIQKLNIKNNAIDTLGKNNDFDEQVKTQSNKNLLNKIINGQIQISSNNNGTMYPRFKNGGNIQNYARKQLNILNAATGLNNTYTNGQFQNFMFRILQSLKHKGNTQVVVVDYENIYSQIQNYTGQMQNIPAIFIILNYMISKVNPQLFNQTFNNNDMDIDDENNYNIKAIIIFKNTQKWDEFKRQLNLISRCKLQNGNWDMNIVNQLPLLRNNNLPVNYRADEIALERIYNFLIKLEENNPGYNYFFGIDMSSTPFSGNVFGQNFRNYRNNNAPNDAIQKLYYGFDDLLLWIIALKLHRVNITTHVMTFDVAFNHNELKSYFDVILPDFPILWKVIPMTANGSFSDTYTFMDTLYNLNLSRLFNNNFVFQFINMNANERNNFYQMFYRKKYLVNNLSNLAKLKK